jgi:hypothetical protein
LISVGLSAFALLPPNYNVLRRFYADADFVGLHSNNCHSNVVTDDDAFVLPARKYQHGVTFRVGEPELYAYHG